jgi:hypothetical protein
MRQLFNRFLSSDDKRIAILLFSAALVLRAAYALYFYFSQPLPATNIYYELAQEIISQGRILYDTSHPYYEFPGPVLPWINAVTMLVLGENYLGLYIVTAVGSSLITLYTYKTARLFLDKRVSVISGLWSLFYLFYFFYTPTPGKDIWMSFFMIFLIYNFIKLFGNQEFSYQRYFVFILMFAISFHLDERFFVFTPIIGLFLLNLDTSGFRKLNFSKTILFALLLIFLMVPWTYRNYRKHDKIVLLSTRTETFTDPIFGYETRAHMLDNANDIYGIYYIHENQFDSVIDGTKTHTDSGRKISPAMVTAMQKGRYPSPLTGIRAFSVRLLSMFEPLQIKGRYERSGYFYYQKSVKHNIVTFLFYGSMFLLSIGGFVKLYNSNTKVFYIFLSVILIYALIHALAIPYTNWRYRLPLDSIFIMVGVYGLVEIYSFTKKKLSIER